MSVRVLVFSLLRDAVGREALDVNLPNESEWAVSDLLDHLYEAHPELKKWDASLLVAVDQEYASRDQTLKSGQEIAIMPPVQGG